MNVGDTFTAPVETLVYGGDGLARIDGRVVFISETAPGDTVRFRVTAVKKNFARAIPLEIISPSPDRIAPCCRVTDPDTGQLTRVPGCVYDHISYPAELAAKHQQLCGFIRRIIRNEDEKIRNWELGVRNENTETPATAASTTSSVPCCNQVPVAAFTPPRSPQLLIPNSQFLIPPVPLHYRNKITLHLQQGRLGYRQDPGHRVLDISACPLARPELNALLATLHESGAFRALPDGTDIVLRHTPHDGAIWWSQSPGHSVSADAPMLTEQSPAGLMLVPRDGFYQVNPAVGDALVRAAQAWFTQIPDTPELLDLYCGVGVFGLACLKAAPTRLTGIESGRAAIDAARLNAKALGLRATFQCAALGQRDRFDPRRYLGEPSRAACIVDPPREGLAPSVAAALAASGIRRILYVSCDPATLTRDLAILLRGGYRLVSVRLFDMFPRTAHFETIAELELAARG